jgi:1,4-alpha-glucan branching enzyme
MAQRRAPAKPKPPPKQRVQVTLDAPAAQQVHVTGTFCDWQANAQPLKKGRDGIWKTTLWLPPGRHEYRFVVDGQWRDDPKCGERVPNSFGTENCVLHVLRKTAQAARATVGSEPAP